MRGGKRWWVIGVDKGREEKERMGREEMMGGGGRKKKCKRLLLKEGVGGGKKRALPCGYIYKTVIDKEAPVGLSIRARTHHEGRRKRGRGRRDREVGWTTGDRMNHPPPIKNEARQ